MAKAPRVKRACAYHLIKAKSRGQTLADDIAISLRLRDRGGLSLAEADLVRPAQALRGAPLVRDGHTGWTTGRPRPGSRPPGRPTARRMPGTTRGLGGWNAERVELTPQVRDEIAARYGPDEDAEDAAEADAAMDEPGASVPWEQVRAGWGRD